MNIQIPVEDSDAEKLAEVFEGAEFNYDEDFEAIYNKNWEIVGIRLYSPRIIEFVAEKIVGDWLAKTEK